MRSAPRPGRFPSDTLSTHLLFGDTFAVWEEAGAWAESWRSARCRWNGSSGTGCRPSSNLRVRIESVGGHDAALCLRRIRLDAVLVRERGAHRRRRSARRERRSTELLWDGDRVSGLRYVDVTAAACESHAVRADVVVGADGRFSFVGDAVGAPYYNVVPPQISPSTRTSAGRAGRAAAFPHLGERGGSRHGDVDPVRRWDLDGRRVHAAGQYEDFRHDHVRLFEERIDGRPASRATPRAGGADRAGARPRRPRESSSGPGRSRLGARGRRGTAQGPIFGQGIGDAVRSAKLLSATSGGRRPRRDLDGALAEFHAYRDRRPPAEVRPDDQEARRGSRRRRLRGSFATLGSTPSSHRAFLNSSPMRFWCMTSSTARSWTPGATIGLTQSDGRPRDRSARMTWRRAWPCAATACWSRRRRSAATYAQ